MITSRVRRFRRIPTESSELISSLEELKNRLARPTHRLLEDVGGIDGDLLILGVGGKMGPSLARLARNAFDEAGKDNRVIGVSRFTKDGLEEHLEEHGVETIRADLTDESRMRDLPVAENVIYMVGRKFGTSGRNDLTWALNAYLPGRVASHWKDSRIVGFSTGNVYPLVPIGEGGSTERDDCDPVGEYAQSCLGRERIFEYFSRRFDIPMVLMRLNYAIDLRYGVLHDVASQVHAEKPVDVSMGHVNVIWQRDANEAALRSLLHCESPPFVLNVTGPETIPVKWLAEQFAERFGVEPVFEGEPEQTALLSNASRAHGLFGYPSVSLQQMVEWTAHWVQSGGPTYDKPTHFQEREGSF